MWTWLWTNGVLARSIAIVVCLNIAVDGAAHDATTRQQPKMDSREICAQLLAKIESEGPLNLDSTSELFIVALDHLGKATSYVTLMRPHLGERKINEYDLNGEELVRAVVAARARLLSEFDVANKSGASEERKRKLLERYFYKACEFKLSTVMTEKLMLEVARKLIGGKLLPDGR